MRTTKNFTDDVYSTVTNFLRGTIASVEALSKVDIGGKAELKVLEKRLMAALAIMDGSLDAKNEAEFQAKEEKP